MKWQERQKEWEIVVSLQKARIAALEEALRGAVDAVTVCGERSCNGE